LSATADWGQWSWHWVLDSREMADAAQRSAAAAAAEAAAAARAADMQAQADERQRRFRLLSAGFKKKEDSFEERLAEAVRGADEAAARAEEATAAAEAAAKVRARCAGLGGLSI
jgi:hypothetical protein